MFGKAALLSAAFALASLVSAQTDNNCPTPSLSRKRAVRADPAFTIPISQLDSELVCVNGFANSPNPFLLVPGTGNNGTQSWQAGYVKLLTNLGYDVCYVSPPPFMLDDIQNNVEYVARAIDRIYNINCRSFPIMGWSQGNLVTQWVLTFYPSTRRKIRQFMSLAGDFRGTAEASILIPFQADMSAPSVYQQDSASNFIAALQAKGGNYNWVPTTSIFSRDDEVIQPEVDDTLAGSTSAMGGTHVGNILAQDFCPTISILHGQELYVDFSYQVVVLALSSPARFATQASVAAYVAANPGVCDSLALAPGLTEDDRATLIGSFTFAAGVVAAPPIVVDAEPPLRAYVAATPDNPVHDF